MNDSTRAFLPESYRGNTAKDSKLLAASRVIYSVYNLLTLPREMYDNYFDSYDLFALHSKEEIEKAYGDNYIDIAQKKITDNYAVLNYLCAIGEIEKMYIPPLLNYDEDLWGNQLLFERALSDDLKGNPGDVMLEFGCGRGRIAQHIGQLNPEVKIYATNVDPVQIKYADRYIRPTNKNLSFGLLNYNTHPLPFEDEAFDGSYEIGAFSMASDLPQLASELYRIIKPGGRFIYGCDWATLPNFDINNALHRELFTKTREVGAGGIYGQTIEGLLNAFESAGFKTITHGDKALDTTYLLKEIINSFTGVDGIFKKLKFLRVFKPYDRLQTLLDRFRTGGDAIIKSHEEEIMTLYYYGVFEKPA